MVMACQMREGELLGKITDTCKTKDLNADVREELTIGDKDYKVIKDPQKVEAKDLTMVFVDVLVVVEDLLYEGIVKFYKNGENSGKPLNPSRRSKSEKESEVVLYVRKFMSAVNLGFQGTFTDPIIKFTIAELLTNLDLDKHAPKNSPFDSMKINRKMKDIIDQEYRDKRYPSYDVILTLVGRKDFLDKGAWGTSGLGEVCKLGKGSILVQDLGQFGGVKMAIHHFGHVLGAYHDGDDQGGDCCPHDFFIMSNYILDLNRPEGKTPHLNLLEDRLNSDTNDRRWSSCSIKLIKEFVKTAGCLRDPPQKERYALYSWEELAHSRSGAPDVYQQCTTLFEDGKGCKSGFRMNANPCLYVQCSEQRDSPCNAKERNHAMEGSACPRGGKLDGRCFKGRCITGNYREFQHNNSEKCFSDGIVHNIVVNPCFNIF